MGQVVTQRLELFQNLLGCAFGTEAEDGKQFGLVDKQQFFEASRESDISVRIVSLAG